MDNRVDISNSDDIINEIQFKTTRSSGKGGQNVNKVSTKVILIFDIQNSRVLNEEQKQILLKKLTTRINKEGILQMSSSAERSQFLNKENVIEKFFHTIEKALTPEKERKPSKPTKASRIRKMELKKELSVKKSSRKKISLHNE